MGGGKHNQGKDLKSPKRVYSSRGNSKRQTTETKSKKQLLSEQFFPAAVYEVFTLEGLYTSAFLIYGTKGITERETKLLICYKFNYSQSNTACSPAGNSISIIIAIVVNMSI